MPISKVQSDVLKVIAASRDPESFVAGGLPLNRSGARYSDDIDIFHDREARVAQAAEEDAKLLQNAGYEVQWLRREAGVYGAVITDPIGQTKLEWVADSDFRFFPAVRDAEFGYVLHVVDLAVNKLMAAATRREARDIVDLMHIHERYLPLGAIVWAAVVVAPGFTPEGLLAELRRNARYNLDAFRRLKADPPIDGGVVMTSLRQAVEDAERFVAAMPTASAGQIYLQDGKPVQPDPTRLQDYTIHTPQRRGHWPSASELTSEMLARLQQSSA